MTDLSIYKYDLTSKIRNNIQINKYYDDLMVINNSNESICENAFELYQENDFLDDSLFKNEGDMINYLFFSFKNYTKSGFLDILCKYLSDSSFPFDLLLNIEYFNEITALGLKNPQIMGNILVIMSKVLFNTKNRTFLKNSDIIRHLFVIENMYDLSLITFSILNSDSDIDLLVLTNLFHISEDLLRSNIEKKSIIGLHCIDRLAYHGIKIPQDLIDFSFKRYESSIDNNVSLLIIRLLKSSIKFNNSHIVFSLKSIDSHLDLYFVELSELFLIHNHNLQQSEIELIVLKISNVISTLPYIQMVFCVQILSMFSNSIHEHETILLFFRFLEINEMSYNCLLSICRYLSNSDVDEENKERILNQVSENISVLETLCENNDEKVTELASLLLQSINKL